MARDSMESRYANKGHKGVLPPYDLGRLRSNNIITIMYMPRVWRKGFVPSD